MKDLFFWLRWKSSYRALYVALLFLFLLSIVAMGLAWQYGDLYTVGWETSGEWKNVTLALDVFDINQFDIQQESQQYFLQQRYVPGDIKVHPWISYAYLGAIITGFIFLLTVISYLELWLYIAGMGVFLYYLVSMHTEQLGIFDMYNRIPIAITILVFSAITYYFNAYGKNIGLFIRIGVIKLAFFVFIGILYFCSSVEYPLLYVSNYSITIPILLSIVFMFIVGYDFMQFIVVITSFGRSEYKTSRNSIWNFIIIGGLYLTNLFIVFFKPAFVADLDLVFLQPFVVLIISAIIGIWMFAEKPEITNNIPFNPLGALLFLALGLITFCTIALGYMTANDALIATLEFAALYIQIGLGLGIFIYVIVNFWNKYKKQEEVYKIFHETYQIPFFVGRSIGWSIIMYFFFSSNSFIYKSSLAAYYNHLADIYLYTGQDDLAKTHYQEAYSNEFQNQRSCYSLGNFYQLHDDKSSAFEYLEACLTKKPTAYAYASLSTFYINNNQLFPAIFMLKDGLKKYPDNPYLLNNLGYLYTQFEQMDSSAYFYSKALTHTNDGIPASNLLAYYASKGKFDPCDTILKTYSGNSSIAFLANKIGTSTISGKKQDVIIIPDIIQNDSIINYTTYTFLYNYAFSKLDQKDSLLHIILDRYIHNPKNEFYRTNLVYAKAIQLYYSQTDIPKALTLLDELVQNEGIALHIITLADWQLKAGLYQQSYETYHLLDTYPDQHMVAFRCLSAYEAGDKNIVQSTLAELSKSQIPQVASLANTLLQSDKNPSTDLYKTLTEKERVQCLHYHSLTPTEYKLYKNWIQDPVQSILFNINYIHTLNGKKEFASAMEQWNSMNKPESVPEEIIAKGNLEYLTIMAGLEQWEKLLTEIKGIRLLKKDEGYVDYFIALAKQHSKDSLQALSYYKRAIEKIGYVDEIQIAYANYLGSVQGDMEALEQLIEAKKIIQYSTPLNVALIDRCLRLGLYQSAESELKAIQSELSAKEIEELKSRFYVTQPSE